MDPNLNQDSNQSYDQASAESTYVQPDYTQPTYTQATYSGTVDSTGYSGTIRRPGKSITCMAFGIGSIFFAVTLAFTYGIGGIFGVAFGIVALVLSKQMTEEGAQMNGMWKAGKTCGLIGIIIGAVVLLIWVIIVIVGIIALIAAAAAGGSSGYYDYLMMLF